MSAPTNLIEFGKKIVAVACNYRLFAEEYGFTSVIEPVIYFKSAALPIDETPAITLPPNLNEIQCGAELGIVIGTNSGVGNSGIPNSQEAFKYVAGYCLALNTCDYGFLKEVAASSRRSTVQQSDAPTVVSRRIHKSRIPDPHDVRLWTNVNDAPQQAGLTDDMIFRIPDLLSRITKRIALEAGDLVLTGTPKGACTIRRQDEVDCGLDELLQMTVKVV